MMKRILILLMFTALYAHAQDVSQEEQELYLATIKAQDVDRQITESDQFKACKDKPNQKEIEQCINDKMKDVDPEEFANKLDLGSYDKEASKDEKSLREYLRKRIHKAVYGVDPDDEKVKQAKLVDHALWSKLYRSQIGKNILMEFSTYCLVNLGYKDNPYIPVNYASLGLKLDDKGNSNVKAIQNANDSSITYKGETGKSIIFEQGSGYTDKNNERVFDHENFNTTSTPSMNTPNFYDQLREYTLHESCNNKKDTFCAKTIIKPDGTEDKVPVRNASYIKAVKEIEFKLGPAYLKNQMKFCSSRIVKNMCELYKCKNIYDSTTDNKLGKNKIENCRKMGITAQSNYTMPYDDNHSPVTDPSDALSTGSIACTVLDKIKEYRKVIMALDEVDKEYKNLEGKSGFHGSMYKAGFYNSGNKEGELSVEEMTTISSTEFTKNVKYGLNEEEIKELREECISPDGSSIIDDKKCKGLVTDLSDEDESIVVAELEAETRAYLKRLESMKDDDESIKEYLIKNGLAKYIDEVGKDNDLLITLIRDEYKSKRAALKKNMMEKFNRMRKKNLDDPNKIAKEEAQIATESLATLEKQQEKIQTLLQYNNVISSYMSAEIKGEGKDSEQTDLSYIRQYELEGMSGEFGDEETKSQYEVYSQNFEDENERSASGNEKMEINLKVIDDLLGNNE